MENELKQLTFEQLVAYTFGELPEQEQQKFDDFLIDNEYYYDLVQNLISYCDKNNLYNRQLLEKEISTQKSELLNQLIQQTSTRSAPQKKQDHNTPQKSKSGYKLLWWVLAILILGSIITFSTWKIIDYFSPDPIREEIPLALNSQMDKLLSDFWEEEKDGLGGAGDATNWESDFKLKRFDTALKKLRDLIETQKQEQPKLYYFAGILELYLKNGRSDKALEYLRKAAPYRNDTEYDYSKHLIIALAAQDEVEEAKLLLDQFPQYTASIPKSLLDKINLSKE